MIVPLVRVLVQFVLRTNINQMITYRTDKMSILRRFLTIRNPPSEECLNILFVCFIDDMRMMRRTQAIVCYVRGYYLEPKYNLELSRDISASFLSII